MKYSKHMAFTLIRACDQPTRMRVKRAANRLMHENRALSREGKRGAKPMPRTLATRLVMEVVR